MFKFTIEPFLSERLTDKLPEYETFQERISTETVGNIILNDVQESVLCEMHLTCMSIYKR